MTPALPSLSEEPARPAPSSKTQETHARAAELGRVIRRYGTTIGAFCAAAGLTAEAIAAGAGHLAVWIRQQGLYPALLMLAAAVVAWGLARLRIGFREELRELGAALHAQGEQMHQAVVAGIAHDRLQTERLTTLERAAAADRARLAQLEQRLGAPGDAAPVPEARAEERTPTAPARIGGPRGPRTTAPPKPSGSTQVIDDEAAGRIAGLPPSRVPTIRDDLPPAPEPDEGSGRRGE